MNIFVLNTGRCGSTTFIKACQHITNYSAAHQSRSGLLGTYHFDYPENHIEADNRLSWFLGRLDKHYGDDAFYVYLKRNNHDTAKSFVKRYNEGIIKTYRKRMLIGLPDESSPMSVSLDYCDTVNSNIELFLKDKNKKMEFLLENAKQDFRKFCDVTGAKGDINAALSEFDICYNASEPTDGKQKKPLFIRIFRKLYRVIVKFPKFIKKA
jgi:hypothetical protein